ncbi:MAG: protease PrsW [Solirubrobacterales bacterium]|jgi:RsiW-degrading membrane proteinase PrsW (M82 family)|nr:protease PrsW [Solirubrobacterales bacterium]
MDPFGADDLILAYALVQAVFALLIVRFLDLYEREPIAICALMFLWGSIVAAILASLGNTALEGQLPRDIDAVFGPAISAPVVEELAKGLALVIAFVASRWVGRRFGYFEFDGVTDGIVYGAAVGIGFAFTEDLYYFFREARLGGVADALSVFVDRRDFFGPAMLRHAIWTATFGAGLGAATWSRTWLGRIGWPLLALSAAMLMHAINNGLETILLSIKYGFQTTYEYLAIGVPVDLADRMDASAASATEALKWISWAYVVLFFAAIALWLHHQRRVIREELEAEAAAGLVSAEDATTAASFTARTRRELAQVRSGDFEGARRTSSLCRTLAELAFTKRRLSGLEDPEAEVERRRESVRDVLAT